MRFLLDYYCGCLVTNLTQGISNWRRNTRFSTNEDIPMTSVNIFSGYKQEEDRFTNGLIAILNLGRFANPDFVSRFIKTLIGIDGSVTRQFRVLQGIEGTADAELSGDTYCLYFETKIVSATLRGEQISAHLSNLRKRTEPLKKLILLTPDDSKSQYIARHLAIDPESLFHLSWRQVYDYLESRANEEQNPVLAELIQQYLRRIRQTVFQQDYAGIILKISFGEESGVFQNTYLEEMQEGRWSYFNTRSRYEKLDGTGRKLLFYDATRRGITAEVEIRRVKHDEDESDYRCINEFEPGTLRVFKTAIPIQHILSISGLENFRKGQNAGRLMTHTQYQALLSYQ